MRQLFARVDSTGAGEVTLEEVIAWAEHQVNEAEEWLSACAELKDFSDSTRMRWLHWRRSKATQDRLVKLGNLCGTIALAGQLEF